MTMQRKMIIPRLLSRILSRYGCRVEQVQPKKLVDIRRGGNHPFAFPYYTQSTPILCELPLEHGRGFRCLPLTPESPHPHIVAVRRALRKPQPFIVMRETLRDYYVQVQVEAPAAWLDVTSGLSPSLLEGPATGLSMPWDLRNPQDWHAARTEFALSENRKLGLEGGLEHGWHFWGPVSEAKLEIEARRLLQLTHSMQTRGYVRCDDDDGDVNAVILRSNENQWRWQVRGGEHRAAVAAAIGLTSIPVRIHQVVSINDVAYWPGVMNGKFDREAAEGVFNRVFQSCFPRVTKDWVASLCKAAPSAGLASIDERVESTKAPFALSRL